MAEAKPQIAKMKFPIDLHSTRLKHCHSKIGDNMSFIILPCAQVLLILQKSAFKLSPTRHVYGQSIQMLSQFFLFFKYYFFWGGRVHRGGPYKESVDQSVR